MISNSGVNSNYMKTKKALVLIDIQLDYFEGGRLPLHDPLLAARNASRLLTHFRKLGWPIVHIQNEAIHKEATFLIKGSSGCQIHPLVEPEPGETIVVKNFPNSFRHTRLQSHLNDLDPTGLVFAGMMTHMCVTSTVRAAWDLGWELELVGDACTTRDLELDGTPIPWLEVHRSHLAALGRFARILTTGDFLAEPGQPG